MPELPEVEALRRALDDPVRAFPIEHAGPAHVATLKTFDPPLSVLVGRRLAGAERRAKRLLFPTEDGELVLLIHLMSAGRVRYLRTGEKGPKTPAFRLRFEGGGQLVLTEGGPKKRAGVWLLTPEAVEAELEHLGPEALDLGAERLGEILADQPRRLHSLLRDQRVIAGIGRAWANEILHTAGMSPFAPAQGLSPGQVQLLADAIDSELTRGLELRERGAKDAKVYRIHNKLHEPCHVCGVSIERVDFDEHTIFYCPECQTSGRILKDRRLSRLLR
jgi:formamidopyrimidine-DNA glycosylase